MNSKIVNVLNKIEEHGFEAYIVGGFVRDYILGTESTDIDICTNALPKDIIKIFAIKKDIVNYGSINIKDGKYNYDITTYRMETNYDKRKPQKITYVNNLLTDIQRRDFTINSLCMNSSGQIIDLLNGKIDIDNHFIRVIGDLKQKLTDDPLRMLRAIRFATILDFRIDPLILSFIKTNKDLIKSLSFNRKKEEIERIISSKNIDKGLKIIKDLDLFAALGISYDKIVNVPDILGIWAQMDFSPNYPFTKSSINSIRMIRLLINEKEITNQSLFKYGLYINLVAGEILGLKKEDINIKYNNLPIHQKSELAINCKDIIDILNIEPSNKLKEIYNDVLINVLNNCLDNNYDKIKKYVLLNWK